MKTLVAKLLTAYLAFHLGVFASTLNWAAFYGPIIGYPQTLSSSCTDSPFPPTQN